MPTGPIRLKAEKLESLDTAGALALLERLAAAGTIIEELALSPSQARVLEAVPRDDPQPQQISGRSP